MKKFQNIIENKLLPISTRIANIKFIQTLSSGMVSILPLLMIGAFASILRNLPITAYQNLIELIKIGPFLELGSKMTTDILSVYMTISVSRSFAQAKGYTQEVNTISMFSLLAFFMLMPFGILDGQFPINYFEFTYLGAQGMFVGILCGAIVPTLYDNVTKFNIQIKMPSGVPPMVATSFENIIPAAILGIIFIFTNFLFTLTPFGNVFDAIYTLVQQPLVGLTGNIFSLLVLVFVSQLLWFVGIHGSTVVLGVIIPVWISMFSENSAVYSSTGVVPNPINVAFFDFATIGGCGVTIGLAILMAFFSKSKQYKSFGKLFLPTGIFNINEPMVFSTPLVLNATFVIPFVIAPIVSVIIGYLAIIVFKLVPAPLGLLNMSYIPPLFRGFINFGVSGIFLELTMILSSILIYYPFFKVADTQAYRQEQVESRE